MEMFTNVPHIPDKRYAVADGIFYHEGDWVRILTKRKAEYIAEIKQITAEEFFDNYYRRTYIPSWYDCTGQWFTSSHKCFKRRGKWMCYHWVSRDV